MRGKTAVLQEALRGQFEEHHGFLAQAMLTRIDQLTTVVAEAADPKAGQFRRYVDR